MGAARRRGLSLSKEIPDTTAPTSLERRQAAEKRRTDRTAAMQRARGQAALARANNFVELDAATPVIIGGSEPLTQHDLLSVRAGSAMTAGERYDLKK